MDGQREKKENLMHLALNMSRYVLGFFFIRPIGGFSLMCYIATTLSWGKWYLQTIHGFWFNLFGVWGLPQMTVPESRPFCTFFALENQFIWPFFDWKLRLILSEMSRWRTSIFSHAFFLTSALFANSRQIFLSSYTGWKVTEAPWGIDLWCCACVSFSLKCDKDFIFLFRRGKKE